MGAVMKTGRYMTTPRGAGRAQKRFDKFSQKHGAAFAKRGVDMSALGSALGFAGSPAGTAMAAARGGRKKKMGRKMGKLAGAGIGAALGQ